MSRSRLIRRASERSSPVRPNPGLIDVANMDRARHDYGSSTGTIRPVPWVYTRTGVFQQVIDSSPTRGDDAGESSDDKVAKASDSDADESVHAHQTDDKETLMKEREADREAKKKQAQWRKWSEDIIPVLIQPYVILLHETDSLRKMENIRDRVTCLGCSAGHELEVSCVFFDSTNFWSLFQYSYY